MSESPPLVPTEVATSVSGFTTPGTEELLPDMDGASNTVSLMPPLICGQGNQIAHPGNVTPALFPALAGNPATPGLPGPSLTYSPTQYKQAVNVAVEEVSSDGSNRNQARSRAQTPASNATA